MTETSFDIHFRGWKDRYHIKTLKAEPVAVVNKWDMDRYEYNVSYKKDGERDQFKFYGSHDDYIHNRKNANKKDLFYMIQARLSDAIDYTEFTIDEFIREFDYDCTEGHRIYNLLRDAYKEVILIWEKDDILLKALNELRDIEKFI
jgi:hypothetical protein